MSSNTLESTELKTYHGNCHCGRFKFQLKIPTLTTVTECNCSLCFKKGCKWVFVETDSMFVERGQGTLKEYKFGKNLTLHFCPTCGTGVMAYQNGMPYVVNVKTLMDVDVWALNVTSFDGKSMPPQYQPPEFVGELPVPSVNIQERQLHTGSCHCGAVTVALIPTGPLSEGKDGIQKCDCSICIRNGTILIYPPPSQVSITGEESLSSYSFGRKFQNHDFCSTCGVAVRLKKLDIGEEKWKEQHPKHKYERHFESLPVNLRLFHGLEWENIEVKKGHWSNFGPKYICPEP